MVVLVSKNKIKVGDVVCRKSYGSDIMFKVIAVKNEGKEVLVDLKGINFRLIADAPAEDLEIRIINEIDEVKHDFM